MASSMLSTAAVASVNRGTKIQASLAPCNGLSSAMFSTFKTKSYIPSSSSNKGFRINCMQVWPPNGNKKFETLSYLPPLSTAALAKEVDYLLRNGWVPCLEFDLKGFVFRDGHKSPGYYDGRYWTMWKLPMFGCTDSSQVIKEVEECKKAYPEAFVRIIGFDNKRQVQCISFIAAKPDGY